MHEITWIDTETSGLLRYDKVFNTGMCATMVDTELKTVEFMGYTDLFNDIPVKISVEATRVNNMTNALLKKIANGTTINDNSIIIQGIIEESEYIGGHNTQFDIRMIENTYKSCGIISKKKYTDTQSLCQKAYKKRMTLTNAIKDIDADLPKEFIRDINDSAYVARSHTALYDAYCTARLYTFLKGYKWVVNIT